MLALLFYAIALSGAAMALAQGKEAAPPPPVQCPNPVPSDTICVKSGSTLKINQGNAP
jgi:hypothetical protein